MQTQLIKLVENTWTYTGLALWACVVPKVPSSGTLVYTSGQRAPWRESPAAGIYLDLDTGYIYDIIT